MSLTVYAGSSMKYEVKEIIPYAMGKDPMLESVCSKALTR